MASNSKKDSKSKYLFDTSAFLSLESVKLIDTVSNYFEILTTPSVVNELTDFSRHDDALGIIAKRVLSQKKKLTIQEVKVTHKLKHVSSTDEQLYNLAKQKNLTLISDDIKLIRHTTRKISRAFSTLFLTNLVHAGILSKKEALSKLEQMRNIRNWRTNIIYLITKEQIENL